MLIQLVWKGYKMSKISYTRKDIARRMSFKLNLSNQETRLLTDCFFDTIQEMITEPKEKIHIEIRNFGVFNVLPTKKRINAMNPRTKEKVIIPPRKKIVFKPSKKMKNELYKSRKFN